jgi:serine/threonine protein kinase
MPRDSERQRNTGFGIDAWFARVVLYAMLYGNVPFKGNDIQEMCPCIIAGNHRLRDKASELSKDYLRKILNANGKTRYIIVDILHHNRCRI